MSWPELKEPMLLDGASLRRLIRSIAGEFSSSHIPEALRVLAERCFQFGENRIQFGILRRDGTAAHFANPVLKAARWHVGVPRCY